MDLYVMCDVATLSKLPPYGDENTVSRKPRPTDSDNYNPKPFGIVQRWRYEDAKNKDKNNK